MCVNRRMEMVYYLIIFTRLLQYDIIYGEGLSLSTHLTSNLHLVDLFLGYFSIISSDICLFDRAFGDGLYQSPELCMLEQ